MKQKKQYRIDIFGLKLGVHDFRFEFDKKIFENIENGVIESGHGTCNVTLDKKETLISIDFEIDGELGLICDRSLEPFDYPIGIKENLILKYGEEFDDSRDDIWVIPNVQESIDLEIIIYQYLSLAVPMKKLHPDFEGQDDEEGFELVYSSEADEPMKEESEETVDPRWAALKNIKNLEN
jgi:uncharacterized metal-binding protein YceD (DUF177 family)